MTAKQAQALERIMAALPDGVRATYRDIAEHAMALGYMPVLKGARETYADFTKGRVKRSILKIDTDPNFPPRLAIRYYTLPAYTPFLEKAVLDRAMALRGDGYEVRCYGCGRCDGTQGYRFTLPDGGQGFWCGRDIMPLPPFGEAQLLEIKAAMRAQDDFYMRTLGGKA